MYAEDEYNHDNEMPYSRELPDLPSALSGIGSPPRADAEVDVVDADASNRASLLVELRAQHTRQFALYRVIGAKADQVFVSGSTE